VWSELGPKFGLSRCLFIHFISESEGFVYSHNVPSVKSQAPGVGQLPLLILISSIANIYTIKILIENLLNN
jgi:hypothetical protein